MIQTYTRKRLEYAIDDARYLARRSRENAWTVEMIGDANRFENITAAELPADRRAYAAWTPSGERLEITANAGKAGSARPFDVYVRTEPPEKIGTVKAHTRALALTYAARIYGAAVMIAASCPESIDEIMGQLEKEARTRNAAQEKRDRKARREQADRDRAEKKARAPQWGAEGPKPCPSINEKIEAVKGNWKRDVENCNELNEDPINDQPDDQADEERPASIYDEEEPEYITKPQHHDESSEPAPDLLPCHGAHAEEKGPDLDFRGVGFAPHEEEPPRIIDRPDLYDDMREDEIRPTPEAVQYWTNFYRAAYRNKKGAELDNAIRINASAIRVTMTNQIEHLNDIIDNGDAALTDYERGMIPSGENSARIALERIQKSIAENKAQLAALKKARTMEALPPCTGPAEGPKPAPAGAKKEPKPYAYDMQATFHDGTRRRIARVASGPEAARKAALRNPKIIAVEDPEPLTERQYSDAYGTRRQKAH